MQAFNALLKRLCRSSQLVLAGRILMFLSSVFPLSEPSGLNKKGAFNTENATAFEAEEELSAAASSSAAQGVSGESTMGDDGMDGSVVADTSGGTECSVDAAFYQTLWSSQRYFKEPQLLQVGIGFVLL
jgi:THO complex subunit 1